MATFKINKNRDFTIMSNFHLRDKNLSLKAKGLLSFMLSLPDDWDYSLKGLVSICKENKDAIRSTLNELKTYHYLIIEPYRTEKGKFGYNYLIYEKPLIEPNKTLNPPYMDFPYTDKPNADNPLQINTNIINTNNKIDNIDNIDKSEAPNTKKNDEQIQHNILTIELIQMNYANEFDTETFYYDDLFKKYLENGKSYKQLYASINYIINKVNLRNYIDEDGNKIINRYGYLKNALEYNFNKFANMPDELYPEEKNNYKDDWLDRR